MFLQKLSLINFKNCREAEFVFSEKINCFFGDNGVGKTNLLDAIYYLSFCKSYFNSIDSQNILHSENFFSIHGTYVKNGDSTALVSCILEQNKRKRFKLNKKEYNRLSDHIGLFPLVMISPYDRDLINEGSDIRRKFIDGVISQYDKTYLDNLIKYNKSLDQRNTLLKRFAENNFFDSEAIEIWDAQLIKYGNMIFNQRTDFLKDFIPIFEDYFEFLTSHLKNNSSRPETVNIEYDSQLKDNDFRSLLENNLQKDRMLKYSTIGTHKDDLIFTIGGYPIKKFGSQGQQKSFVIAIKLAQFEYTKKIKGFKPVLLFDDIFDKLDNLRVEQLIKLVSNNSFGQVFITDTQRERIEKVFHTVKIDHKIFQVLNGKSTEISDI